MHVAIIGNGIAGITTARELRKRRPDWRITVVSGESDHHWSRPALMYVYMGHMRFADTKPYEDRFWSANRIELVRAWVTAIDLARKRLELDRADGPLDFDALVLATGSVTAKHGWPGQELAGVQGLYGLADLAALEAATAGARGAATPGARRAVIVGGGLIGVELAEMLHSRRVAVTFLVREPSYWSRVLPPEESAMVTRVIRAAGIDLRLATELGSIEGDERGRAAAVVTTAGERIACELVGITTGVAPNVALARAAGLACRRGVLVDAAFRTGVPGVYAAGDCAEIVADGAAAGRVEQLWYTGRMHGEVLARVLAGEDARYERGVFFNSAKFFDLEYQTYGDVGRDVPGERSLYWEARDGLHALRIVYTDAGVIGFNCMGIRYRQKVCERWIRERRSLDFVLAHLGEANFDPEFFRRHEREIARAWRPRAAARGRDGRGAGA